MRDVLTLIKRYLLKYFYINSYIRLKISKLKEAKYVKY